MAKRKAKNLIEEKSDVYIVSIQAIIDSFMAQEIDVYEHVISFMEKERDLILGRYKMGVYLCKVSKEYRADQKKPKAKQKYGKFFWEKMGRLFSYQGRSVLDAAKSMAIAWDDPTEFTRLLDLRGDGDCYLTLSHFDELTRLDNNQEREDFAVTALGDHLTSKELRDAITDYKSGSRRKKDTPSPRNIQSVVVAIQRTAIGFNKKYQDSWMSKNFNVVALLKKLPDGAIQQKTLDDVKLAKETVGNVVAEARKLHYGLSNALEVMEEKYSKLEKKE
jgi:hypothetical protein